MKIRWTHGGVRFRIAPEELDSLLAGRTVRERLTLPGGGWEASLLPGEATALTMNGAGLTVSLSVEDLGVLASSETEGVYFQQDGEVEGGLRYYVEKDFPCAHPRPSEVGEGTTATFAPPPGFEQRKIA
jgi:hypothetical protein